ncbi:hypothetical protein EVAR_89511_1 [Eumeta japonica]|uniref:Uncharacterized protein n=1 Tax=Eumeta variegata TaxID=151549 RepID=A0A4C1Y9N8_EUMVA|nr:hypothetical protein EVAR_89511_1 [Eumeta japonica]
MALILDQKCKLGLQGRRLRTHIEVEVRLYIRRVEHLFQNVHLARKTYKATTDFFCAPAIDTRSIPVSIVLLDGGALPYDLPDSSRSLGHGATEREKTTTEKFKVHEETRASRVTAVRRQPTVNFLNLTLQLDDRGRNECGGKGGRCSPRARAAAALTRYAEYENMIGDSDNRLVWVEDGLPHEITPRYPIHSQKLGNVLVIALELRLSMGGDDHLLSDDSHARLPILSYKNVATYKHSKHCTHKMHCSCHRQNNVFKFIDYDAVLYAPAENGLPIDG